MSLVKFCLTLSVALCCYSQQPATRYKPIVTARPSSLPPGGVRAVTGAMESQGLLLLMDSQNAAQTFSVVDLAGANPGRIRSVPASPSSLVAFSDKYVVWNQPTPLNSVLHVFSLHDNTQKTVTSDIRGIIQLALVEEDVIAAHKQNGSITVTRINLLTAKSARVDSFSEDARVLHFGQSSPSAIVLVDPVNARFRVIRPNPDSPSASWLPIDSTIVQEAKSEKARLTPGPSAGDFHPTVVYNLSVIGHFLGTQDTHWFVVARSEKGVGRYAVKLDTTGREVARMILEYPDGRPKSAGFVQFAGILPGAPQDQHLDLVTFDGNWLRYEGVAK